MINKGIILAFFAGVTVGAGICYIYDKYYRKKETVTVTKYVCKDGKEESVNIPDKEEVFRPAGDTSVVNDIYHEVIQFSSNEPSGTPADSTADLAEGIREISQTEFEYDNYYSKITLRYYRKDGILIDEDNDTVELLEDTISVEGPDCIGRKVPGIAYIRNDLLHIDYEVLEDERSYHEIRGVEEGTFIS